MAKRKCGLGLIMTKLEKSIYYSIAMSIVVLNLRKIQSAFFKVLLNWLMLRGLSGKFTFVQ